jgi:hypothetical protein
MTKSSCSTADVAATPADTLRDAAAYLAEHGWIQGEAFATTTAEQPACCVYGAIRIACGGSPRAYVTSDQDIAISRAMYALAIHLHPGYRPHHRDGNLNPFIPAQRIVTGWNDQQTAADDVIAALHAAADEWDRHHCSGHDISCMCSDCIQLRRAG